MSRRRKHQPAEVWQIAELVERILADVEVDILLRAWNVCRAWRAAVERIFASRFRNAAQDRAMRREIRDGVTALAARPNCSPGEIIRAFRLVTPVAATFTALDIQGFAGREYARWVFRRKLAAWLERVIAEACAAGNFPVAAECLERLGRNWMRLRRTPPDLLPGAALLGQARSGVFALEAVLRDGGRYAGGARGWLRRVVADFEASALAHIQAAVLERQAATNARAKAAASPSEAVWTLLAVTAKCGSDVFLARAFNLRLADVYCAYRAQSSTQTKNYTHNLVQHAARAGQARTVETLSLAGARCSRRTVLEAIEGGDIPLIEACVQAYGRAPKGGAHVSFWPLGLCWAARRGRAEVVHKYATLGNLDRGDCAYLAAFAAAGGHANIMWWLHHKYSARPAHDLYVVLLHATAGGQLDIVRELHTVHGVPLYSHRQPSTEPDLEYENFEDRPVYEWAAGVAGAIVGEPYFGGWQEPKYYYRRLRETDAPFTPEREATLRWVLERLPLDWSPELAAKALETIGKAKNQHPAGHAAVERIAAELRTGP